MAFLGKLVRWLMLLVAFAMLTVGGVAMAAGWLPENGLVESMRGALVNAAANLAALSNRSAANFSNALAVVAATCGGTDFRNCVIALGSSVTIFEMIAWAEEPVCGGSPVNIS